ncbi:uncharacterized protein LOC141854921 [Brevipalpus obovatus]|uniref:uncharacterized protein LOC141854921 n=1 Tax=Brevipalpus obovatus TaxID=246614 RepID=UPI003D9E3918
MNTNSKTKPLTAAKLETKTSASKISTTSVKPKTITSSLSTSISSRGKIATSSSTPTTPSATTITTTTTTTPSTAKSVTKTVPIKPPVRLTTAKNVAKTGDKMNGNSSTSNSIGSKSTAKNITRSGVGQNGKQLRSTTSTTTTATSTTTTNTKTNSIINNKRTPMGKMNPPPSSGAGSELKNSSWSSRSVAFRNRGASLIIAQKASSASIGGLTTLTSSSPSNNPTGYIDPITNTDQSSVINSNYLDQFNSNLISQPLLPQDMSHLGKSVRAYVNKENKVTSGDGDSLLSPDKQAYFSTAIHANNPPIISGQNCANTGSSIPTDMAYRMPKVQRAYSYKADLEDLCQKNALPRPIFKLLNFNKKPHEPITWVAKVKIEGIGDFSSYPIACPQPNDAEEECSKVALRKLRESIFAYAPSQAPERGGFTDSELLGQILQLLTQDQYHSLKARTIPELYMKEFNVKIPADWLERIRCFNDEIDIDEQEFSNAKIVILRLPSPSKAKTKTSPKSCSEPIPIKSNQSPSSDKENNEHIYQSDQCSPSPPSPGILELLLETLSLAEQPLPENDEGLEVIVSKIVNTKIVFLRLVEHNNEYVDLVDRIYQHYTNSPNSIERISIGNMYAGVFPEHETSLRLQAIRELPNDIALCLSVDIGGFEQVPVKALHSIDPEFLRLPYQAIPVQMKDLIEYHEDERATEILTEIVENCVHQVVVAVPHTKERPVHVTLYDVNEEEDRDLNQVVLEKLKQLH